MVMMLVLLICAHKRNGQIKNSDLIMEMNNKSKDDLSLHGIVFNTFHIICLGKSGGLLNKIIDGPTKTMQQSMSCDVMPHNTDIKY